MNEQNKSSKGINQSAINPDHKKVGPIIAILIIVLVLIFAALYLFATKLNQPALPTDGSSTADTIQQDETVSSINNSSDDTSSIQLDLKASVNGVDSQNF